MITISSCRAASHTFLLVVDDGDDDLVMVEISDHKVKLAYFAALIASLPKHNRALMKYMCYFLADIASHSEKTKMDINNLSMIFAPSLLGIPDSELDSHGAVAAPMKGPTGHLQLVSAARFLKDAQQCQKILAFILQNVHQVLVVCINDAVLSELSLSLSCVLTTTYANTGCVGWNSTRRSLPCNARGAATTYDARIRSPVGPSVAFDQAR